MPTDSSGCGVQPPEPSHLLESIEDWTALPCLDCQGNGKRLVSGAARLLRREICSECDGVGAIILGRTSSSVLPGLQHIIRYDGWEPHACLCGLRIFTQDLHSPQGLGCAACVKARARL